MILASGIQTVAETGALPNNQNYVFKFHRLPGPRGLTERCKNPIFMAE